jgi:hypothetical protein
MRHAKKMKYPLQSPRLKGDFNGLFGDLLCLSHSEICKDETGAEVTLRAGMVVTVFDDDSDDQGIAIISSQRE